MNPVRNNPSFPSHVHPTSSIMDAGVIAPGSSHAFVTEPVAATASHSDYTTRLHCIIQGSRVPVSIRFDETIYVLKEKVAQLTGASIDHIRILHGGTSFADETTIFDSGMIMAGGIHVIIKKPA